MLKPVWPSDYPSHITLPPKDASFKNVRLYRLVENNPPVPTDFAASYKDPDQAHLVKYSKFSDNQSFYGTSMFSQKQAVQNLIESNPHRFRKKLVAYGQVEAQHGVVGKESVAKHVTVWFYDGVSPNGFVVI